MFITSQQHQLPCGWLAQPDDAQTEQPKRTLHPPLASEKKTAEPIEVSRLGQWVFDGNLARQCGEIAVAP